MLESLFNNVMACNFIKKRHQHRCFSVRAFTVASKAVASKEFVMRVTDSD